MRHSVAVYYRVLLARGVPDWKAVRLALDWHHSFD